MPAKYDPHKALPLRVPPELRRALETLTARLPAPLRLPRNTIAVLALARGLAVLGAELQRDPMALHRALVGGGAVAGEAPSTHAASAEHTPETPAPPHATATPGRPRRPKATSTADLDGDALRRRWKRSGLPVLPFAKRHEIPRSVLQAWAAGRPAARRTLAKIAAALDLEGK